MNILVFTPYLSKFQIGAYSRYLFANSLGNQHSVSMYNVNIDGSSESVLEKQQNIGSYDIAIQHCPYEYINILPEMKNVWIPIIQNLSDIQDPYLDHYTHKLDAICTENKFTEMVIAKSTQNASKLKNFDFSIEESQKTEINKINFGQYNAAFKYYTILDYSVDQLGLLNLIKSFSATYRNNPAYFLGILLSCSPEQYEYVMSVIKDLSKDLSMHSQISNISIYSTANISIEDTLPLHNSCDMYLNIEYSAESVHKYFAKLYGSSIIDRLDIDYSDSYVYKNNSCFGYLNKTYALVSDSFNFIFNRDRETKPTRTSNIKLTEILSEI